MQAFSVEHFNHMVKEQLPAADFCGVAVTDINATRCTVSMTHQHANQNPFGSIYFAALAMAAFFSASSCCCNARTCSGVTAG